MFASKAISFGVGIYLFIYLKLRVSEQKIINKRYILNYFIV